MPSLTNKQNERTKDKLKEGKKGKNKQEAKSKKKRKKEQREKDRMNGKKASKKKWRKEERKRKLNTERKKNMVLYYLKLLLEDPHRSSHHPWAPQRKMTWAILSVDLIEFKTFRFMTLGFPSLVPRKIDINIVYPSFVLGHTHCIQH